MTLRFVVGAGKGTLGLTKNAGTKFNHTPLPKQARLTISSLPTPPDGYLASGSTITIKNDADTPTWTPFRSDNGDGKADAGEVKITSGAAELSYCVTTSLITAVTTTWY